MSGNDKWGDRPSRHGALLGRALRPKKSWPHLSHKGVRCPREPQAEIQVSTSRTRTSRTRTSLQQTSSSRVDPTSAASQLGSAVRVTIPCGGAGG